MRLHSILMLVVICISLFGLTKVIYDYFKDKETLTFSPGANVTEYSGFKADEYRVKIGFSENEDGEDIQYHQLAIVDGNQDDKWLLSVSGKKIIFYGDNKKTLTLDYSGKEMVLFGDLEREEAVESFLKALIIATNNEPLRSSLCVGPDQTTNK